VLAAYPIHGDPSTFRDVRVHVIDSWGHPAAGRKVDLVGLERFSMEEVSGDDYHGLPSGHWHFVTSKTGDVIIPIGDFAGWEDNETRPGWGVYAAVVEAGPDDAGGVSTRFWFDNAPSHHGYDPNSIGLAPEWGYIDYLPVEGINLAVRLEKGFTLKGSVVDDQHPDVPLAGVDVRTNNDLHAETHTGIGGEILGGYAKTDAHGNFAIPHQFPAKLYVSIQPTIWLKTRIDGEWKDEVHSVVEPAANGDVRILEIGATRTARFKYAGRVSDADGKPVAGAEVTINLLSNPDPNSETWIKNPDATSGSTKADGSYEITTPTSWARWINADAGQLHGTYNPDNATLPPGNYDIALRPNAPKK
jgi:hypothetical protein